MKKLDDLLKHVTHTRIVGHTNKIVEKISYNSRESIDNSIFVAIRGIETDGHKYIDSAINNGANIIVCEFLPEEPKEDITYIKCENTRIALAELSHAFFDFPANKLKIIGITGTNGKTTISFLLKSIFDAAGYNSAIIGTTGIYYNNEFHNTTHTTPESLELASIFDDLHKKNLEYVFMEVSSHALALFRTFKIDFKAAIFTNLSLDHLDYHKNMDDYASAKKILFEGLSDSAISVLNGDDKYAEFMTNNIANKNIYYVGRNISNDFIITDEELNLNFSKFNIYGKLNCEIQTKLLGSFNIENAAMCVSLASLIGIEIITIKNALGNADGAPGRMQKVNLKNGAIGLVDYAHTPDALEKALKSARNAIYTTNNNSKLICVFGCGGDRDKSKRPIMGAISTQLADYTIITSDNPRTENPISIIKDIVSGIENNNGQYEIIEDREVAIKKAFEISNKNDLILVAGKGHENYQIIGKEKFHFDDTEQLRKFA